MLEDSRCRRCGRDSSVSLLTERVYEMRTAQRMISWTDQNTSFSLYVLCDVEHGDRQEEGWCATRTLEATTFIRTCGSLCVHCGKMIINTRAMRQKPHIGPREHRRNAWCGKAGNPTLNANIDGHQSDGQLGHNDFDFIVNEQFHFDSEGYRIDTVDRHDLQVSLNLVKLPTFFLDVLDLISRVSITSYNNVLMWCHSFGRIIWWTNHLSRIQSIFLDLRYELLLIDFVLHPEDTENIRFVSSNE